MQVYCLDWDCEGQRLASASIDKTVRVWNVEHRYKDREERYENEFKHSSRLYCLHWHPSKPTDLVTSCDDKYIRCTIRPSLQHLRASDLQTWTSQHYPSGGKIMLCFDTSASDVSSSSGQR